MNYKICYVFALAFFDAAIIPAALLDMPEPFLVPCDVGDLQCLKRSTKLFLSHTYKGIPSIDILPIDPLSISGVDVPFQGDNLVYSNKNITMIGLSSQTLEALKMDLRTRSVALTTSADVYIRGDINQVNRNLGRSVAGHFRTSGSVLCTALYSYTFGRDGMDVEHYVVGPETISCEVVDTPVVSFSSPLAETCNDTFCPEEIKQLWKTNFSKIMEKAYVTVVHNIRAAAKVLPATAFFKNPHGNGN
ncbi:juvenile hormone-binding protein-like isoform X2 [Cydia splendana]|uniref:juvenile hormone-binding protein-like isoform X2 n=1 Tax=Cydia splendana TaxID=1100963 RepID=UPI0028F46270